MKVAKSLAIATLLVILVTQCLCPHWYAIAQSSGWPWTVPRHSLGFPSSLNTSIYRELLQQLRVSINVSAQQPQTYISRQVLDVVSSRIGVPPSTIESIVNSIESPEAREELIRLLKAYANHEINPQQLVNALKALTRSYATGTVNPEAYRAALDLIERIASSAGLDVSKLYGNILSNIEIPKYLASTLGNLPGLPTPSIKSLPSIAFPNANQALIVFAISIAAILSGFALATLLRRFSIVSRIRIATRVSRFLEAHFGKPVIREYWRAVAIIESKLGIRKLDSETHWEFFDRVREKLGSVSESFRKLTTLYELCRFGGVESESMDREAKACVEVIARWSVST